MSPVPVWQPISALRCGTLSDTDKERPQQSGKRPQQRGKRQQQCRERPQLSAKRHSLAALRSTAASPDALWPLTALLRQFTALLRPLTDLLGPLSDLLRPLLVGVRQCSAAECTYGPPYTRSSPRGQGLGTRLALHSREDRSRLRSEFSYYNSFFVVQLCWSFKIWLSFYFVRHSVALTFVAIFF